MLADFTTDVSRLVGRVVGGRYIIEDLLGVGGSGLVARARHAYLNRSVALKLLLPSLSPDLEARERFVREARVAGAIRHPNVVEIIDFGVDGTLQYLSMELLTGSDLRGILG